MRVRPLHMRAQGRVWEIGLWTSTVRSLRPSDDRETGQTDVRGTAPRFSAAQDAGRAAATCGTLGKVWITWDIFGGGPFDNEQPVFFSS